MDTDNVENKFEKQQNEDKVKKFKDRSKNDRKACIQFNQFDTKTPYWIKKGNVR
jgi:hypothetical protein